MKKLLLLSLFACATTQTYGALSSLKTAAAALSTNLKRAATKSFTTSSPLKTTLSDTIWQTEEGKIVRIMGDKHVASEKPYFKSIKSSLEKMAKTNFQTTFIVEGGDIIGNNDEPTIVLGQLNKWAKNSSLTNISFVISQGRRDPGFRNLILFIGYLNILIRLAAIDTSILLAQLTPENIDLYTTNCLNPRYFLFYNHDILTQTETHIQTLIKLLQIFIKHENNNQLCSLFTNVIQQLNELLDLLPSLKKVELSPAESLLYTVHTTLDIRTFIQIIKEINFDRLKSRCF